MVINPISFPDAASWSIEELIFFHDHSMIVLLYISLFVRIILGDLLFNPYYSMSYSSNHTVEAVWTTLPMVLLCLLGFPSIWLLYLLDEGTEPTITLKVVGHQWYWSYELSDLNFLSEFDSYIVKRGAAETFRLLDVDNRLSLPALCQIRALVTSSDVIHSWTIPSLGVKADAIPGRLNQISFWAKRTGLFYGQCSEICGVNHRFMPIVMESVSSKDFIAWAISKWGVSW